MAAVLLIQKPNFCRISILKNVMACWWLIPLFIGEFRIQKKLHWLIDTNSSFYWWISNLCGFESASLVTENRIFPHVLNFYTFDNSTPWKFLKQSKLGTTPPTFQITWQHFWWSFRSSRWLEPSQCLCFLRLVDFKLEVIDDISLIYHLSLLNWNKLIICYPSGWTPILSNSGVRGGVGPPIWCILKVTGTV